jgi:hypothetical protein
MSSSPTSVLLSVFYLVILLFATSDLKRFIFHVHISRVDRVPVEVDIDPSSSSLSTLWYPILIGIIFNIFILIFSILNLYIILCRQHLSCRFCLSTLILLILFTIRFIINIIITKNRNGLSTPTLVERSFLASSLSLEEELTTLTLDWIFKIIAFIFTFIFCYRNKQEQTMSVERRRETKLMSSFD